MGESIVEASIFEKKMGESVTSVTPLDSSVSFGRFENDSLSWEKWSTFSPNKYLEEVEKCSTPGSVAQKKAYFEAHYKNFPARKAELEQAKLVEPSPPMWDQFKCENTTENDTVFIVRNGEGSTEKVNQEADVFSVVNSTTSDDIREDIGERSNEEVENSTIFYGMRKDVGERCNEEFENSTTFDGMREDAGERSIEEVENSTTSDDIKKYVSKRSTEEVDQEVDVHNAVNSTGFDAVREDFSERSTEEVDQEVDVCSAVDRTCFDAVEEDFSERSTEEVKQKVAVSSVINSITFDDIKEDLGDRSNEGVEHEGAVSSVVSNTTFDDIREGALSAGGCQSSLVDEIKKEMSGSQSVNTMESKEREKVMLLEEEHTSQKSFPKVVKRASKMDNETKNAPESGNKSLKVKAGNITQKKTPTKKDKILPVTKKKAMSPAAKSSPASAPQLSRPTPTSSSISTFQSASKKFNGTLLPRNKNTPVRENRRAAPTSLHMSLNLGQANSSVSPASTRKSLIMEQMADKDIIKRAFKSFQNNYSQLRSSCDDKFSGVSQVSSEVRDSKVTPSLTPRKENEGSRKTADKRTPQRGQSGNKSSSVSSGLGSSAAKKNVKAVSPSVGLRSDDKAEKRREFLKKLEQKSIAREVEKAELSTNSKEKNADMEKGKQNSNLIATPVRTYSKGGVPKSSQKEGVKNKVHLQNR